MTRPTLHNRLAAGCDLLGCIQVFPNLVLTELAGHCGYDFIVLDSEHGTFTETEVLQALQIVASTPMAAIVRIRGHDAYSLQSLGRYLDLGADGILIPNVSTTEQAQAIVRAADYAPKGTRGYSASSQRITRYGADLAQHVSAPRERVFLIALIESREAVANVEAILATDGIDAAIIGSADLKADFGRLGASDFPELADCLDQLEQAGKNSGKPFGIPPNPAFPIQHLRARGHRIFILGSDIQLIRDSMDAQIKAARD